MAPQFPQLLSFKAQEFVLGYLFSSLLTSNPFARPSGSPSTSVPFSPSPNPPSCQAPSTLPTATLVSEIQPDSHLPVGLKIPVLITTHRALQEPCHLATAPLTLDHSLEAGACYVFHPRLYPHPGWYGRSRGRPHDGLLRSLLTYLSEGSFLPPYLDITLVMFASCQSPPLRAEVCHTHHCTPRPSEEFLAMGSTQKRWANKGIHPSFEPHWESVMGPILAISISYLSPYLSPKPGSELMRLRPVLA